MKKQIISIATMLLSVAVLTVSCSSEQMVENTPSATELDNVAIKTYTVSIPASKPSDDITRALYFEGSALKTQWGEGERVYVYKDDSEYVGYLEPATTGGTSTTLQGIITGVFTTTNTLTLYYLKPKAACVDYAGSTYFGDYSGQDGMIETISSSFDFMKATVGIESVGPATMTTGQGGSFSDNILKTAAATDENKFTRQQSITKFTVVKKNGVAMGSDNVTKLNISAAAGLTGGQELTNGSGLTDIYVAIANPQSTTYDFDAQLGGKTYTSPTRTVNLANGSYYTATLTMGKSAHAFTVDANSDDFTNAAIDITVKDEDNNTLAASTNYTVTYEKKNGESWEPCDAANVKDAGTYRATVVAAAASDYEGSTIKEFTIGKGTPTITVPAGKDGSVLVVGGSDLVIGATNDLGGTITYESANTAIATVDGSGNVHAVSGGQVTITMSIAATDNLNAAEDKTITIYVKQSGIGGEVPDPSTGSGW